MLCSSPLHLDWLPHEVGCGQCMSCRINRKRTWTGKLLLEATDHPADRNYFVTLTLNDDHLVKTPDGSPTLDKRQGALFRRRLARVEPGLRHFFVGEYGTEGDRPHYHAMLYGMKSWDPVKTIANAWNDKQTGPLGFIQAEPLTPGRAAYIAGYTTKKLTAKDDVRLGQRHPEYATMSRRPGLGDLYVRSMISWLQSKKGQRYLGATIDVPRSFRTYGKIYPFSNRHVRMMRVALGLDPNRSNIALAHYPALEKEREPIDLDARRQREVQLEKKTKIFSRSRL